MRKMSVGNCIGTRVCFTFAMFAFCGVATAAFAQETEVVSESVKPVLINRAVLSGLELGAVKDPKQPDRELFQRRLILGRDISVYVVSSESATADHKGYPFDEFLYLINGGAKMKPVDGEESSYRTGDFFAVPKGLPMTIFVV